MAWREPRSFLTLLPSFSSFRSQTSIKTELRPVAVLFCISKQGKDKHLQCSLALIRPNSLLVVEFVTAGVAQSAISV